MKRLILLSLACAAAGAQTPNPEWQPTPPPGLPSVSLPVVTSSDALPSDPPAAPAEGCGAAESGPHLWAVRRGCDYGYENKDSAGLVFVSFLGRMGDAYRWVLRDGGMNSATFIDCTGDCLYMRFRVHASGQVISNQAMRATKGSFAWALRQDAATKVVAANTMPGCGTGEMRDYLNRFVCYPPDIQRSVLD